MAKKCSSNVKDQGLNYVSANCSKLIVCKGEPPTYAAAMATANNKIATWAMTTATGTDYQKSDTGTGRQLKVSSQSSLVPDSTGVADHVALVSTALSELIFITTISSQTVGSTANRLALTTWAIVIADAT